MSFSSSFHLFVSLSPIPLEYKFTDSEIVCTIYKIKFIYNCFFFERFCVLFTVTVQYSAVQCCFIVSLKSMCAYSIIHCTLLIKTKTKTIWNKSETSFFFTFQNQFFTYQFIDDDDIDDRVQNSVYNLAQEIETTQYLLSASVAWCATNNILFI